MRRKPKFREPVAVLQRRNIAAMEAMAPTADAAAAIRAQFDPMFKAMPVKRKPKTEPTQAKSEKEIQSEILAYLRSHHAVAWAHRFNRGTAVSQDEHGRHYHIKFNTCPGFSDIHLLLKSGRAGYVEVKVPGKSPTDDQADFLLACWETGALAMVARSVEDMERAMTVCACSDKHAAVCADEPKCRPSYCRLNTCR